MTFTLPFDNTYARLPERFYTKMPAGPVANPALIALNRPLADRLGLDPNALASEDGIATLAGNLTPEGADPLAQVYAGHQFGGFSPRLGDGRALLLGEIVAPDGKRFDVQLKGSGPTPYSRNGDGRAWVGPVIREYIVSEAMLALGVPTTRALAAISTGETIYREGPLPGAVLTRVAASHIRVGTFQYFASQGDVEALEELTTYALQRHYPDAEGPLGLLDGVIERQASLIAQWLGLGFIHGVMNTDNMTISGETIDYGPCAFQDQFHPMRVFSSIDHQGRYAFMRQPEMGLWNLVQLANALMPLIKDQGAAQASVDRFAELFQTAYGAAFRAKIGLATHREGDDQLIQDLLTEMTDSQADFTNTFRALGQVDAVDQFADRDAFSEWEKRWKTRLAEEGTSPKDRAATMAKVNPWIIPRTHRIEQAIQAATAGDFQPFERLNAALSTPFEEREGFEDLTRVPTETEVVPRTFCGT